VQVSQNKLTPKQDCRPHDASASPRTTCSVETETQVSNSRFCILGNSGNAELGASADGICVDVTEGASVEAEAVDGAAAREVRSHDQGPGHWGNYQAKSPVRIAESCVSMAESRVLASRIQDIVRHVSALIHPQMLFRRRCRRDL